MSSVLRTRITRIGNSRGIRVPKVFLEQLGLEGEVELTLQPDRLVVRPARRPRAGWDDAFQRMAQQGDDRLLDEATATEWERTDWEW